MRIHRAWLSYSRSILRISCTLGSSGPSSASISRSDDRSASMTPSSPFARPPVVPQHQVTTHTLCVYLSLSLACSPSPFPGERSTAPPWCFPRHSTRPHIVHQHHIRTQARSLSLPLALSWRPPHNSLAHLSCVNTKSPHTLSLSRARALSLSLARSPFPGAMSEGPPRRLSRHSRAHLSCIYIM